MNSVRDMAEESWSQIEGLLLFHELIVEAPSGAAREELINAVCAAIIHAYAQPGLEIKVVA